MLEHTEVGFNINDWYVVLIWDPDREDTSPWSVKAKTVQEAVQIAESYWYESFDDVDYPEDHVLTARQVAARKKRVERNLGCGPDIHKAYASSYIGERVMV